MTRLVTAELLMSASAPAPGSCSRSGRRSRSRSPTSSPTSSTRTTPARTCRPAPGEPGRDAPGRLPVLRRGAGAHARRPHRRQRVRLGDAEDALHARPGRLRVFGAKLIAWPRPCSSSCSSSTCWVRWRAGRSPRTRGRTSPGRARGSSSGASPAAGSCSPSGRRSASSRRGHARHRPRDRHRHPLCVRRRGPAERARPRGQPPGGLVEFFVRANGYSLVAVLGVSADDVSDTGPGSFSGPFVAGRPGAARPGGLPRRVRRGRGLAPPLARRRVNAQAAFA